MRWIFALLSCFVWPAVIEYGGISFECDADVCAIPKEDYSADAIVRKFRKLLDFEFMGCYIHDSEGKRQWFHPYPENCYSDLGFPFLMLHRFAWEKADRGVDGSDDDDTFYPDDNYFSRQEYPINQTGILRAFEQVRKDMLYYQNERIDFYRRKVAAIEGKLVKYLTYESEGYSCLEIDPDSGAILGPERYADLSEDDREERCFRFLLTEINSCQKRLETVLEKQKKNAAQWQPDLEMIDRAFREIDDLLKEIFLWCLEHHQPEGIAFDGAVEALYANDLPEALEYIRNLLAIAEENDFDSDFISKIHMLKGQLQSEFCLHADAVISLTEAIHKNPFLKDAYLERAAAYFELGEFDHATEDYLMQRAFSIADQGEFAKGFAFGGASGVAEALEEFIPNTLSSLYGLGHFLWTAVQHPIETPREAIYSVLEICKILRDSTALELAELAIPELSELIATWDQIEDFARGQKAGHIFGKYGTEILSPLALKKGVNFITHLRDLKRAEKLATLRAISDAEKRGEILETSAKWAKKRSEKLSKVKLEVDKQNKHVPGKHNYDPEKSIVYQHVDAQELLDKFAGKGRSITGVPERAGYREKVNFGVIIGECRDELGTYSIPTTWGTIHYSKAGAHIVPALPDNF